MVTGEQDLGSERWKAEKEMIDHQAEQARMEHEVDRAEAEKAAERGEPAPAKRPWWKFWGS